MSRDYFHRVADMFGTRVWVNNPTRSEAQQAIEDGAIACTTNPTYTAKMLSHADEGEYARAQLRELGAHAGGGKEDVVAQLQRRLARGLMQLFMPVYERSGGTSGFVSVQCNPHWEHDPDVLIRDALEASRIGANYISKIPVTQAGLVAIEHVLGEGIPVIATEVMTVSQAAEVCAVEARVRPAKGELPSLFITHISGIFDEYIRQEAQRRDLGVSDEALSVAGLAVARRVRDVMDARGSKATLLGGGARAARHFTGMIGGKTHVTINPATIEELVGEAPPQHSIFDIPVAEPLIQELLDKHTDFTAAALDDALSVSDFEAYGPVKYFRDMFETGWDRAVASLDVP